MPLARIGLGANLGAAGATIERAIVALAALGEVVARSALYRTAPWGDLDQPDFVNAAVLLETARGPHDLLRALQALEREFGRVPSRRYGPRAIDLDILAYGDVALHDERLELPHPRLRERAFALVPLAEIDGRYRAACDALSEAERAGVQRIPEKASRITPAVNWDETLERIRSAAEFCASGDLTRFRIEEDGLEIELRRTPRPVVVAPPVPAEEDHSAPLDGHAPHGNGAIAGDAPRIVRAEFVGIVRFSRPTVVAGADLVEDRELAYVESLGIRNPVRSGGPGRVREIFVADGDAVDYGQPLFALESAVSVG